MKGYENMDSMLESKKSKTKFEIGSEMNFHFINISDFLHHVNLSTTKENKIFSLLILMHKRGSTDGLWSKRSRVRFPASPLWFQRLVISCFQVGIWMKDCLSGVNPQNNQPTTTAQKRQHPNAVYDVKDKLLHLGLQKFVKTKCQN